MEILFESLLEVWVICGIGLKQILVVSKNYLV